MEVPEGLEPSTFSSVARRSNPIELWDHLAKISKKTPIIKRFYGYCYSLNKNIIVENPDSDSDVSEEVSSDKESVEAPETAE